MVEICNIQIIFTTIFKKKAHIKQGNWAYLGVFIEISSLRANFLKLRNMTEIKKVLWYYLKFWDIFSDMYWGFHQKLGAGGGTLIFLLLNFTLFLINIWDFPTWKNLKIQNFFFSWLSTYLRYIDPQQKYFLPYKPVHPQRFLSNSWKSSILRP